MRSRSHAVLLDVDGTLVDTNWFHTLSWWRTFLKAGEDVPMSRIHPLIGMGSDQLVKALLGEERDDLKDLHSGEFEPFMSEIHAFPGAGGLLRAVSKRAVQVVLCTSAKKDHLEPMLEVIGAMDAVDEIVNADDVEKSKPAPDVFTAALDKNGLDPANCMVVGDTRWDVEAAAKVGLETVCVLTGGSSREQLLEAGAVAVYEDVAELLAALDESPLRRVFDAS